MEKSADFYGQEKSADFSVGGEIVWWDTSLTCVAHSYISIMVKRGKNQPNLPLHRGVSLVRAYSGKTAIVSSLVKTPTLALLARVANTSGAMLDTILLTM